MVNVYWLIIPNQLHNLTETGENEDNKQQKIGTCICGKKGQGTRIVGGKEAEVNELPWTVALLRTSQPIFGIFFIPSRKPRPFCGGTLINDRNVITAAHCIDGLKPSQLEVLLNEHNVLTTEETPVPTIRSTVSQILRHPSYNPRTIDHDIAILSLSEPITFRPGLELRPACLPSDDGDNFAEKDALVAGWGTTKQGGSTSNVLRKVTVPIMTNEKCNTLYPGKITDRMMCAGFLEGGKDSCQGDSGGPLVLPEKETHTLIGVVSWGIGCAQKNRPGVYTRVSKFQQWIRENTKEAKWCEGSSAK